MDFEVEQVDMTEDEEDQFSQGGGSDDDAPKVAELDDKSLSD